MVGTPLSTDEIHRLLAEEKIGWLATVSPKGQPHAIPINFGFFNDIVHIIFVDDKSRSVRNIRNNERVSLGINLEFNKAVVGMDLRLRCRFIPVVS